MDAGTERGVGAPGGGPNPPSGSLLTGFVVAVDAAAVIALVLLPGEGLDVRPGTLWLLTGLALMAGLRRVSIAALKTGLIATHPFWLCALAAVGPHGAAVVSLAGVLGSTTKQQRRHPIRLCFNVGVVVLSTVLAAAAFLAAGGTSGARVITLIWPLAAATAVFFAVNTGLVAVAIALEKSEGIVATWKRSFQWTAVSFSTGLTLAVGLTLVLETLGPWGLALGIPPCWLLISFYRAYKERLEEHQRRIDLITGINEELERRVAERTHELQEALGRIEELQTLKQTLTQTLVHDLKNPLTAVVGNLDLLERQAEERTLKLVRRSKAGASRLLRMILDLLDISKLEDGRFVLQPEPVDTADVARRAIEEAEPSAAARDVGLALDAPAPGPTSIVRGDRSMLRRVLDNLISNALQHSPAGSTVTVSVMARSVGVELSVADQGPGIPEAYREKVFEKYARLDLREAGLTENRGLGLTFCRLAVEAHGGSIRAEEAPGGGALFRATLPENAQPVEPDVHPLASGAPTEPRPAVEGAVVASAVGGDGPS